MAKLVPILMALSVFLLSASPANHQENSSDKITFGTVPLEMGMTQDSVLAGVLRTLVRPDRLPHFQIDLPASSSGSAVGDQWFGLADRSVTAARRASVLPLHRWRVSPRGNTVAAMAPGSRCERSTMEGAGERRGGTPMKAAVYTRYGPPDVVQISGLEKPVPPQCVSGQP